MILSRKPLSIAETKAYIKDLEEKKNLVSYFKNFSKITKDKAEKLKEKIVALNNPKIKEEDIIKVVDFLPEDIEDINKIFNEVSLSQEEANKILELVKSI